MLKGTACTITYTTWDSGTGGLKTGDITNHTCTWMKDGGTPATCTNTPSEVGGGVYKIALTATETNCDLGTLMISTSTTGAVCPPVHIVFHDANQYKADVSGIPASVWANSSRTLTSSAGASAADIWNYSGDRTLTSSPTDISGLATASNLSTLQTTANAIKAKTDNLPSSPAAVGSAMNLTSAYDAAKTAAPTVSQIQNGLATASAVSTLQTSVSSLSIPTVSQIQNGLATASALSTLQTSVSGLPTVSQIQNGLASSTDLAALGELVAKVFALVGSWSVSDDTLTAYDSEGNTIYTGTLTRDTNDQITAITETTDTEATT